MLLSPKILLLGSYVPAPLTAYLLRSMGAEVLKVETDQGDHLRHIGAVGPDPETKMSPMFRALNAGFRSIALQWKQPAGAAILRQLIAQAHIIIDGNRRGTLEKALGQSPESISPLIIYVSLTAYGLSGPLSHLAGHDNNILALAGNLSYTDHNTEGLPAPFSAPVADILAGQSAAFAAVTALLARAQGNTQPIRIDASMLHAGFFLNLLAVSESNQPDWQPPQPGQAWMNGGRADYSSYRTADNKAIFFGLLEPWALQRFLMSIGMDECIPLIHQQDQLRPHLTALFATKTQAEWIQIGTDLDACITPINDLNQAIHHPQIQHLGLVQQVHDPRLGTLQLPTLPFAFGPDSHQPTLPTTAPQLGEHTTQILKEWLNYTQDQITQTLKTGIATQFPK